MSYRWDKVVKGATKSKQSPPKAKYIDPIIDATYEDPASMYEISGALSTRLRDPNSTVMFKALITIHTLLRAGNIKTVFESLSGYNPLPLDAVVAGHDTAQDLTKYALYLDRRIKTYAAIKYDIMRDSNPEEGNPANGNFRLRTLSVQKGLLRETAHLQKVLDALVDCKLYIGDMDDDVALTGVRLLVKDLLTLFQAVNEAIINILEHYFEMAKSDAEQVCKIYRRFCTQTDKVVAYLKIARKLENIIRVPIPNLKHAPVSLAKSLEEYLHDPNFEQNRLEYRDNKRIADGAGPSSTSQSAAKPSSSNPTATSTTTTTAGPSKSDTSTQSTSKPAASTSTSTSNANDNGSNNNDKNSKINADKNFMDFFETIEKEQQSMFQPNNSVGPATAPFGQQPQQIQQQFVPNPFGAVQAPFGVQAQPTGFQIQPVQTQMTGFPGAMTAQPTGFNPFMQQQQQQPQPQPQQNTLSPFQQQQQQQPQQMMQQQPTGFLMPQQTGANPFRQSMIGMPTGTMPMFSSAQQQQQQQQPAMNPLSSSTATTATTSTTASSNNNSVPTLSASPPPISQSPNHLTPQKTGSMNPFAPPPGQHLVKKPSQPSMNQLVSNSMQQQQQQQQQFLPSSTPSVTQPQQQNLAPTPTGNPWTANASLSSPMKSLTADVTGVESLNPSFLQQQPTVTSAGAGAGVSSSTLSGAFSSTPARSNTLPNISSNPTSNGNANGLTAQPTGYASKGLSEPFKPTSSFGASLVEQFGASSPPPTTSITSTSQSLSVSTPPPVSSSLVSQPTGNPFGAISSPMQFNPQQHNTQFSPLNQTLTGIGNLSINPPFQNQTPLQQPPAQQQQSQQQQQQQSQSASLI